MLFNPSFSSILHCLQFLVLFRVSTYWQMTKTEQFQSDAVHFNATDSHPLKKLYLSIVLYCSLCLYVPISYFSISQYLLANWCFVALKSVRQHCWHCVCRTWTMGVTAKVISLREDFSRILGLSMFAVSSSSWSWELLKISRYLRERQRRRGRHPFERKEFIAEWLSCWLLEISARV